MKGVKEIEKYSREKIILEKHMNKNRSIKRNRKKRR